MSLRLAISIMRGLRYTLRGYYAASSIPDTTGLPESSAQINPLRLHFDSVTDGPGLWKWHHYFPVYHRHLARFVGQPVHIAEVGVYGGGSLSMWKKYFGCLSTIHGIDIQPVCRKYETDAVRIHVGDQADRSFWRSFKESVPQLHALVDDGGHQPEQQIVTLEEILPHLQPGGVYICEDIAGERNRFAQYLNGLTNSINHHGLHRDTIDAPVTVATPSSLQRSIASICYYPYMVVIERHDHPPNLLRAPRRGSEWQEYKL